MKWLKALKNFAIVNIGSFIWFIGSELFKIKSQLAQAPLIRRYTAYSELVYKATEKSEMLLKVSKISLIFCFVFIGISVVVLIYDLIKFHNKKA